MFDPTSRYHPLETATHTLTDGRTVFVPRTAPGDVAEIEGITLSRTFARARLRRLVEAAADRTEPRCPHYTRDDCGGCQLQHIQTDGQRAARRRLVWDALTRIGRLELDQPELVASDADWGYRAKISLAAKNGGATSGIAQSATTKAAVAIRPIIGVRPRRERSCP